MHNYRGIALWIGPWICLGMLAGCPVEGDDDTADDDDVTGDDDTPGDDDSSSDDDDSSGDDDDTMSDDDDSAGDDDDSAGDDDDSVGDDDDSAAVADADGDGWDEDVDCDDSDASLNLDDLDSDGFDTCSGDCADDDPQRYPGATEQCNGLDDDCDGFAPSTEIDQDGDGMSICAGDCDEGDVTVHAGATELCDGLDNDCDGTVPADEADDDGDGAASCAGDCDDGDAAVHPGAAEGCDGLDTNCDGLTPVDETDLDGDGVTECAGDCDEGDAAVHAGAVEVCGNAVDEDCDGVADDGCGCDLTVPSDHSSIQDAIDHAVGGAGICVLAGTYDEILDFGGAEVHVLGVDGPEATIIDGNGWGTVATFQSGEGPTAVLQGFTLTNGAWADGAGVRVTGGSNPTLVDLVIENNVATGCGGGLYVDSPSDSITDVVVRDNAAEIGGGVCIGEEVTLERMEITGNTSIDQGGGIYIDGLGPEHLILRDSIVASNVSTSDDGGGIYVDGSVVELSGVDLVDNEAGPYGSGGAIHCYGELLDPHWGTTNVCYLYLEDVLLQGNQARNGGGVYADRWDGEVLNSWAVDNYASADGGGFYLGYAPGYPYPTYEWSSVVVVANEAGDDGGGVYEDVAMSYYNSVFAHNVAGGDGGGICGSLGGAIRNNLFAYNEAGGSGGAVYDDGGTGNGVEYCNAWDNQPANYGNMVDPTGVDGNVSVDPELLDLSDADPFLWDLHLDPASALIDAGDPTLSDPDGSVSDIGAYGGEDADATDLDGDGYDEWWLPGPFDLATSPTLDCDDREATVYPGAPEICDGLDNDCDGHVPADEVDGDGDGHLQCDDCDDTDPAIHPGAAEPCDGVDNDCDGVADLGDVLDVDGDGITACDGDCDDTDPAVYPGAAEACNGLDDDCDGQLGVDEADADGDGAMACAGDCDDDDPDLDLADLDGDGYDTCAGDCDDSNPSVHPGQTETCDGEDDDCDGIVDNGCGCDYTVPGDHPTIQDAIDGVPGGSTVCVEPGTYYENLDFHGSEVYVRSTDGPAATIIDGSAAGTVVTFQTGESAATGIEGFTLTNGYADTGGGLYVYYALPTLRDLVITGNEAYDYGGGGYFEGCASEMTHLEVVGNTAIESAGFKFYVSSLDLTYSVFEDNDCTWGAGGLDVESSDGYLDNLWIEDNDALFGSAGGADLEAVTGLEASHLYVHSNSGSTAGGLKLTSWVVLTNSIVSSNYGEENGGVYVSDMASLTNIVVDDNSGHFSCGGLSVGDYTSVVNTVVTNNDSSWDDGGLCADYTVTIRYTDLWNNTPTDYGGINSPVGSSGNISEDPEFLGSGDYHIQAASPLADGGDTSRFDPDTTTSDIGAYGGSDADLWDLDWDGYPQWWQPDPYDFASYPAQGLDCDDLDASVFPDNGC